MKVVISDWPRVPKTTGAGKWSVSIDRKLLTTTLREAAGRADQEHPAVLASCTQPVERCDAIQAFTGRSKRWGWESAFSGSSQQNKTRS